MSTQVQTLGRVSPQKEEYRKQKKVKLQNSISGIHALVSDSLKKIELTKRVHTKIAGRRVNVMS
jgi:hypothetical protein